MKNGKNPTKKQWKIIEDAGLAPDNWLVSKHEVSRMVIVYRYSDTPVIREIML